MFTEWQSTGNSFTSNVYVDGSVNTAWTIGGTGHFGSNTLTFSNNWETYHPTGSGATPTQSQYWVFNNTWGQPNNTTISKDFTQSITVDPVSFPNGTTLSWDYSKVPAADIWSGVLGYPSIIYGTIPGQPGGFGSSSVISNSVPAKQLGSFNNLSMTFDFTKNGAANESNVMMEFYPFDMQAPTGPGHEQFEIQFLLAPDAATRGYAEAQSSATKFSTPGYSGVVAKEPGNPTIIVFCPTTNITSGTIDLKACLAVIESLGWVSPSLWLQGLQFGAEPRSGIDSQAVEPYAGSVTVNQLSYVWN